MNATGFSGIMIWKELEDNSQARVSHQVSRDEVKITESERIGIGLYLIMSWLRKEIGFRVISRLAIGFFEPQEAPPCYRSVSANTLGLVDRPG